MAMSGGMNPRKVTATAGRPSHRQTGNGMANPSELMRKSKNRYCVEEEAIKGDWVDNKINNQQTDGTAPNITTTCV